MFNEGIEVGVIECDMQRERERERERVCVGCQESQGKEMKVNILINKNFYYDKWNAPSTRYIY